MKRTLAVADLLLVSPGIVFFLALFLRNFLPSGDPANGAQQIVMWYAGRRWTLWVLLIGLPLSALLLGATVLRRTWVNDDSLRRDAQQAMLAFRAHLAFLANGIAALAAAAVLFLVALHMMAD
jgi:hypothetical protein